MSRTAPFTSQAGPPPGGARRPGSWAGGEAVTVGVVLAAWATAAGALASRCEVWVDETTQLAGLTLPPAGIVTWLAGHGPDLGFPPDRAPPLSYLAGWLWSRVLGTGEGAQRTLGVVCVGAGLVVVVRAARHVAGPAAGWVAGLGLALSPTVLAAGVEIRPYPLLLALSCVVWAAAARLLADRGEPARTWAALDAAGLAAAGAHFFGLVAAGGALVALAPGAIADQARRRRWALGAGVVGLAALAVAPFALASLGLGPIAGTAGVSAPLGAGEVARGAARLAYRLLGGHPATAALVLPAVLVLAGAVGLLAVSALALEGGPRRAARGLLLGVLAGLVATTAARLSAASFDAFLPSYAIWAAPALALAASLAVAAPRPRARRAALGLAIAWVAGNAGGAAVLLARAEVFAHAPSGRLAAELSAGGGPEAGVVVHDGAVRHAWYPLRRALGDRLRQVTREDAERRPGALGDGRVLLVTSYPLSGAELGAVVRGGAPPRAPGGGVRAWLEARGWRGRGRRTLVAFMACEVEWFDPPAAPPR